MVIARKISDMINVTYVVFGIGIVEPAGNTRASTFTVEGLSQDDRERLVIVELGRGEGHTAATHCTRSVHHADIRRYVLE